MVLVIASTLLEFFEEFRSNQAAEKLKQLVATTTTVLRDGKEVAIPIKDITLGDASILTVISGNNVEEFKINILKVMQNEKSKKNILFEVTDERLLESAGGIVQGMSGSPIIQNNMIIGAVTHVVVDDCRKGYGIFIENMLEEDEN